MQAPNLIWTYWKKEQKKFEHQLERLKNKMEAAAIHESRVAVKKLRACLELYLQLTKEKGYESLLRKTEVLFGIMGRQRDIEICLELLPRFEKEYNSPFRELTAFLKQQWKNARARTHRCIHTYHRKELQRIALLLKKDTRLNNDSSLPGSIRAVLYHHTGTLRDHFKNPHQLRQHLKQIYYWIDLFPEEEYRRKELQQVLEGIGNWQDAEILLSRARHFRKDYLPAAFAEHNQIKCLEQQLKALKEKLRKAALRKTGSWQKKLLRSGQGFLDSPATQAKEVNIIP